MTDVFSGLIAVFRLEQQWNAERVWLLIASLAEAPTQGCQRRQSDILPGLRRDRDWVLRAAILSIESWCHL